MRKLKKAATRVAGALLFWAAVMSIAPQAASAATSTFTIPSQSNCVNWENSMGTTAAASGPTVAPLAGYSSQTVASRSLLSKRASNGSYTLIATGSWTTVRSYSSAPSTMPGSSWKVSAYGSGSYRIGYQAAWWTGSAWIYSSRAIQGYAYFDAEIFGMMFIGNTDVCGVL
jgi:hypothetical protein